MLLRFGFSLGLGFDLGFRLFEGVFLWLEGSCGKGFVRIEFSIAGLDSRA